MWSGTAGPSCRRIDRSTGEPYMLQLDMQGCRFDRLNNGAPVFDTHFTGDDFKSLIAGKVGTRAQVGVVRRAWPNGDKGMATLQFDLGDPDGAEMFRKASTGILQNLSFGTFIYKREKIDAQTEGMPEGKPPYLNDKEIGMFKATDWEPFEISPCTVPADFNTCFLSAQPTGEVTIFGTPDTRRDRCSTGNQPTKGETCNAGNDHAGNGRGCPCCERTGPGRRAGRGGPGRTGARQRDPSRWALPQSNTGSTRPSSASSSPRACPSIRPGRNCSPISRRRASRDPPHGRSESGIPDSRRGRRLGDPRRHGAAPGLHADGAAAARRRAVLPGAAPGPQRQRHRGIPRWLRSRAAAARRRDGPRVPQLQAHRHGQGSTWNCAASTRAAWT